VEDDQVPHRPFAMAPGGPVRVATGAGVDVRAGPALKIVGGEWGHVSNREPRRRRRRRQATHSSGTAEASSLSPRPSSSSSSAATAATSVRLRRVLVGAARSFGGRLGQSGRAVTRTRAQVLALCGMPSRLINGIKHLRAEWTPGRKIREGTVA
jgi:hypothetical protein